MKERTVLYGVLFIMGVMAVTGWSPVARAITPTGPGLQDGNGVYMGQLLSTNYSPNDNSGQEGISYTTYLPAVDGVLQFQSNGNGGSTLFQDIPANVYYTQPGCTGTAYIDAADGSPWIHPWIVEVSIDGTATWRTYKVASSTDTGVATQSLAQSFSCTNQSETVLAGHKLKAVSLPFDPNTITTPFKITAM